MTVFRAPGRVNLIGEHTDHGGGLSLPVAIDRGIELEVTRRSDRIELRSGRHPPTDIPADGGGPAEGWGRFAAAVAVELASLGRRPVGIEGSLSSDLPEGAGLASSAALCVAIGLALCDAAGFSIDAQDLALACSRAEERAVGVRCGVMDQIASIHGRRGHAVLLDASSMETELVPLPPDLRLLVLHSGIRRRLEASEYDRRREELRRALEGSTDQVATRRLRHFRSENERVMEMVRTLRADPPDPSRIGSILRDGHASLRDDFEVSTPEIDALVGIAVATGCVGARVTGAGFGGAVLALTEADDADAIGGATIERYRDAYPTLPAFHLVCEAAGGAARLD